MTPLFDEHFQVSTVREMGWDGLKNGKLLRAASSVFDVFVTMDRSLRYQQNLNAFDLGVLVISSVSNAFPVVSALMPKVNVAARMIESGTAVVVER
ncbi:MAG: hypothetical protein AAGI08_07305 [Bacteroidota bacterium]